MRLDKFDRTVRQEISDSPGDYIGILNRLYGMKISSDGNARKKVSMLKHHLDYKIRVDVDEREIGEMEETIVKADGSVTTKRMLILSERDSKDPKKVMELMGYDPSKHMSTDSVKKNRNF